MKSFSLSRMWTLLALLPCAALAQTNAGLSIAITSPTNGTFYPAPGNIELIAGVQVSNDTVTAVEFFDGSNEIGISTNFVVLDPPPSPGLHPGGRAFFLEWTNDTSGVHTLTATASDGSGITVTSAPVTITIGSGAPPPPAVVTITQPSNGETFTAPTNVMFTVAVDDPDTNVAYVTFAGQPGGSNVPTPIELFLGSVSNYVSPNPPTRIYTFVWSNTPPNTWYVTAAAVLGNGLSAGSASVQFTVEKASSGSSFSIDLASPTNGESYAQPTNIELIAGVQVSNDTVTAVEFFDGSNEIGISTNFAIVDPPGSPGLPPGSHAYFLDWSNQTPGLHVLTASATDTNGRTEISAPVTITIGPITPPPPPVVTITEPPNEAVFTAPVNIPIDALIYDPAGNVAYVTFTASTYPNYSNLVGTARGTLALGNVSNFVSEPPNKLYSLTWSNVGAATWEIAATAVSSNGTSLGSTNVQITVGTTPPPQFSIDIASPTNGTFYPAPTNIQLVADISGTNQDVPYVEFFNGTNEIGISTNFAVVDPPGSPGEPAGSRAYLLEWTNDMPGVHILTATAPDEHGNIITSAPVTITIGNATPPPPPPPVVTITQPTNGQTFRAPANVLIDANVFEGGAVASVNFVAVPSGPGPQPLFVLFLGSVSNYVSPNPSNRIYSLDWSNAPVGTWSITANAVLSNGVSAGGASVRIKVVQSTNIPPIVRVTSPANNTEFRAPVNVALLAYADASSGSVASVEFFAGSNALGFGAPLGVRIAEPLTPVSPPILPIAFPTNVFELIWSNAPPGSYAITALATDNYGNTATSAPVNITILPPPTPPTNRPAIVSIVATDPIAIAGTNCWRWLGGPPTWSNWVSPAAIWNWYTNCGPKDATFTVFRGGNTNSDLTVNYSIGGAATNGVDYATLPGSVTIPAGQSAAMITIVPIDATTSIVTKTIILELQPTTNVPVDYLVGVPRAAEALIIDSVRPQPLGGFLPDGSFHLSLTGPDGAWFHIDYSTDLINWTTLCTNQVIDGAIDFIDPNAATSPEREYRAVPIPNPPSD